MKKNIVFLFFFIVIILFLFDYTLPLSFTKDQDKQNYLILVEREADKQLYQGYIQDRSNRFDITILSLEEKGIPNEPKAIKKLLKELYQISPFYYAVFDETIVFHTILFTGKDWKNDVRSDNEYVNLDEDDRYIPEFYLSRITHSFLEKQWTTLPQQSVLFALPILHYDHYVSRCRGYWTSWCDLRFIGHEYSKLLKEKNIPFTEMYENRYSYRQDKIQGTVQLNQENFHNFYKTSSLVISTSTVEPLIIDLNEITYFYTLHSNLYTATWQDADKDKWVDFEAKEVTIEEFCDFNKLEGYEKRIWILPTLKMPSNNEHLYCYTSRFDDLFPNIWYLRDNQGKRDSYASAYCLIIDKLLSGESMSKCVFDAYRDYILKYNDTNFALLTYFVYGPPETTFQDLIVNAKMDILPKEIQEKSELSIPIQHDSAEITFRNTGAVSIEYAIEFDHSLLEIVPADGSIEPNQEQSVIININLDSYRSLSVPKPKQTTITIKSNAGNRKIIVRWMDV